MSFEGKVALVTGGTSGIGEECVRQLINEKCRVIFIGRRKELGEHIVADITAKASGQIEYIEFDLLEFKKYDELVKQITEKYHRLDLLVNNAGKVIYQTCESLTEEQFDEIYQTNVKTVWLMTKKFHSLLELSKGCVVNIGSDVSIKANKEYFGYSDSKASVVHITKMMALEYAPAVRVNAVCPGDTFVLRWTSDEQLAMRFGPEHIHNPIIRPQLVQQLHESIEIPLKRVGEVEEIANAVLFLGSSKASFITGVALLVDGGASLV
ncbi:hypothetical protein EIN_056360 [Entamoeba invadens IP1]|uniref:hypothetical protein n=1 Tax=Entamoeba invadens IP1 TaxID=370355 RepID=UPI0002C3D2E7|nr:hypothetical protein EIN_056360 [Entamoeba invadens IP1]ELP93261.1 hypothetical protein EIN_056360 [Entamoeba invadens IP1]|eukprot:XP_004260032.1 hypothetical protein EIN_056360 [Entamoeba invadens IP1]